jgi:hypothetical protein
MLLVQVVRVPVDGIDRFRSFEATVLPLVPAYGGELERRLRSLDGTIEIHVVSFASREGFEQYLANPTRQEHLPLLRTSEASAELFEVMDVTGETD